MNDFWGGFVIGIIIVCYLLGLMWVGSNRPVKMTTSGEYYIKTHCKYYKLVSEKPFKIATSLKEQ